MPELIMSWKRSGAPSWESDDDEDLLSEENKLSTKPGDDDDDDDEVDEEALLGLLEGDDEEFSVANAKTISVPSSAKTSSKGTSKSTVSSSTKSTSKSSTTSSNKNVAKPTSGNKVSTTKTTLKQTPQSSKTVTKTVTPTGNKTVTTVKTPSAKKPTSAEVTTKKVATKVSAKQQVVVTKQVQPAKTVTVSKTTPKETTKTTSIGKRLGPPISASSSQPVKKAVVSVKQPQTKSVKKVAAPKKTEQSRKQFKYEPIIFSGNQPIETDDTPVLDILDPEQDLSFEELNSEGQISESIIDTSQSDGYRQDNIIMGEENLSQEQVTLENSVVMEDDDEIIGQNPKNIDSDDSDSDSEAHGRGRFVTERSNIITISTSNKRDAIPDTLEISKEQEKEINEFLVTGRGRRGVRGGQGRGGHGRGRGGNFQHPIHQQNQIQTTYHQQPQQLHSQWTHPQQAPVPERQVVPPHQQMEMDNQSMLLPGQVPSSQSSNASRKILINPHFKGSQQQASMASTSHVQHYQNPHQQYNTPPVHSAPSSGPQPLMQQPLQAPQHLVPPAPHMGAPPHQGAPPYPVHDRHPVSQQIGGYPPQPYQQGVPASHGYPSVSVPQMAPPQHPQPVFQGVPAHPGSRPLLHPPPQQLEYQQRGPPPPQHRAPVPHQQYQGPPYPHQQPQRGPPPPPHQLGQQFQLAQHPQPQHQVDYRPQNPQQVQGFRGPPTSQYSGPPQPLMQSVPQPGGYQRPHHPQQVPQQMPQQHLQQMPRPQQQQMNIPPRPHTSPGFNQSQRPPVIQQQQQQHQVRPQQQKVFRPRMQLANKRPAVDQAKLLHSKKLQERARRFQQNKINVANVKVIKTVAIKRPSGESDQVQTPAKIPKVEQTAPQKELTEDEKEMQKKLEEQRKKREMIIKMKEARRQALADQRRQQVQNQQIKDEVKNVEKAIEKQSAQFTSPKQILQPATTQQIQQKNQPQAAQAQPTNQGVIRGQGQVQARGQSARGHFRGRGQMPPRFGAPGQQNRMPFANNMRMPGRLMRGPPRPMHRGPMQMRGMFHGPNQGLRPQGPNQGLRPQGPNFHQGGPGPMQGSRPGPMQGSRPKHPGVAQRRGINRGLARGRGRGAATQRQNSQQGQQFQGQGQTPIVQQAQNVKAPGKKMVRKKIIRRNALGEIIETTVILEPYREPQTDHQLSGGDEQAPAMAERQVTMQQQQKGKAVLKKNGVQRTVVENTPPQREVVMNDRKVVSQQFANQPNRRIVVDVQNRALIQNLSTSTTEESIKNLCNSVGPIQNLELMKGQRKAIVTFMTSNDAQAFVTRYHRKMIDLSHISVKLISG